MYAGKIVEIGSAEKIYQNPLNPYTEGLMRSFPPLSGEIKDFGGIPGKPPDLLNPPAGCRFAPRCAKAQARCASIGPELQKIEADHLVSCLLYSEELD